MRRIREFDAGHSSPCHLLEKRNGELLKPHLGYARIPVRQGDGTFKMRPAYLHFYEQANGKLDAGYQPDHLCRNRACVRLDHLEAVPQRINIRRGLATKLTQEQVDQMRALRESGESNLKLAAMFGVSAGHCCNILKGNNWADGLSPAWQRTKARRAEARVVR